MVVIGGGATGVEIAAEFKTILPNIGVTLINSNSQLVGPFSERSQQALQNQLTTQFGIKLVLGMSLVPWVNILECIFHFSIVLHDFWGLGTSFTQL